MAENNPYHPLATPDDPTQFFGRENAVAFLRQHLVGAFNREMILILAHAGMGKSSLLKHIPFIVDERYQPVYLGLTPQDVSDSVTLLNFVYRTIVNHMEVARVSTYRFPDFPDPGTPEAEIRTWFAEDFMNIVLTAIHRGRYLLLMFDDLHLIYDAVENGDLPADIFDYLAELLAAHDRLDIVGTLDLRHESRALHYPVTSNLNFHYRLGRLAEEAARRIIVEPVASVYKYTDDAIRQILKFAGGHPFLLHSICRLLYRYSEGGKQLTLVGMSALESVYPAALEETGEIMQPFWEEANPNTRAVLRALLDLQQARSDREVHSNMLYDAFLRRASNGATQTQFASILRSLEYDGLIDVSAAGTCSFAAVLESDWLLLNTIADTSERMRPVIPLTRARMTAIGAILLVIFIIGSILVLGVFNSREPANPDPEVPPTLTLEVNPSQTQEITRTPLPSPGSTAEEAGE